MCGNSACKAFNLAFKVERLARKAQKAARKPNVFAREVPELGVPSKKPCTPSQTLCRPPRLLRPPQSAVGRSVAELCAQATPGRAPLAGIQAPLVLSGLSASKLGVPPAASRASGVSSGASLSKARAFNAQGAVRGALRAARRAHRGIACPNGVARELAELGVSLATCGGPCTRSASSERLTSLPFRSGGIQPGHSAWCGFPFRIAQRHGRTSQQFFRI